MLALIVTSLSMEYNDDFAGFCIFQKWHACLCVSHKYSPTDDCTVSQFLQYEAACTLVEVAPDSWTLIDPYWYTKAVSHKHFLVPVVKVDLTV